MKLISTVLSFLKAVELADMPDFLFVQQEGALPYNYQTK